MWNNLACLAAAFAAVSALGAAAAAGAANLPHYDHIVLVVEENKDFSEIVGNPAAPYINRLAAEGTSLTRMYGEEHNSEGNYFWLFSGDNQNVGFLDKVPTVKFAAPNLGAALIAHGLGFKGYSEALPAIGSEVNVVPAGCRYPCAYGRKHVPWISFSNVPSGGAAETSSNLRFADFPQDFAQLPTVAFVIPDMNNDMHNDAPKDSIPLGDAWLQRNIDPYYQWAKTHNSLLIVTFDENDDKSGYTGLTNPKPPLGCFAKPPRDAQLCRDLENHIATIFAGAHVRRGYADPEPLTHVNLLRTIEAIYRLAKSGAQQPNAAGIGIADGATAAGVFAPGD